MLDKLKQNSTNSRDASSFLKKRALLEEEYARGVIKLAGSYLDQTVVDKTYDSYLPTPSKLALLREGYIDLTRIVG